MTPRNKIRIITRRVFRNKNKTSGRAEWFQLPLINATALEYELTLVTTNARLFPIAGLKVEEFPTG
jgi:predicted nucleic acid-binding protein